MVKETFIFGISFFLFNIIGKTNTDQFAAHCGTLGRSHLNVYVSIEDFSFACCSYPPYRRYIDERKRNSRSEVIYNERLEKQIEETISKLFIWS